MTTAEFKLLCAACGLNGQQVAALFEVHPRSAQYWLSPKSKIKSVPVAVGNKIHELNELIDNFCSDKLYRSKNRLPSLPRQDKVYLRVCKDASDICAFYPDFCNMPASVHLAALSRCKSLLEASGYVVEVIWFGNTK